MVMAVIHTMARFGYLLYGALGICLVGIVGVGIFTGRWELAIVTALVSSVSAGASAASGFMAGVLSQTFKSNAGASDEPISVTTPPGEPLQTTDVTGDPQVEAKLPPTTEGELPE